MTLLVVLLILALLIAILAVVFALQNTAVITVTFFIWTFEQSIALVLLFAYLAGALSMMLLILPSIIKNRRKITVQNKKIKDLAKTLPDDTE